MSECSFSREHTGQRQGIQTTRGNGHDGHVNTHLLVQFLSVEDTHSHLPVARHGLTDEVRYLLKQRLLRSVYRVPLSGLEHSIDQFHVKFTL